MIAGVIMWVRHRVIYGKFSSTEDQPSTFWHEEEVNSEHIGEGEAMAVATVMGLYFRDLIWCCGFLHNKLLPIFSYSDL